MTTSDTPVQTPNDISISQPAPRMPSTQPLPTQLAATPPAPEGPFTTPPAPQTRALTPPPTTKSSPTQPALAPAAPTPAPPSLRDHLLAALATHPGTRIHHLHALVSVPRRTGELFPFATPRPPRVWVQDILVLLSEQGLADEGKEGDGQADERPRTPPPGGSTNNTAGHGPRVLTTAISAALFLIPATASGILYISKVDTTGQARAPSPAALLVRALVGFFADPATRPLPARSVVKHMWVHVFARAQAQYLFSASAECEGKRPLGDTQLCAWWRRVLGRVGGAVAAARAAEGISVRMRYVLPGLGEEEAARALRGAGPAEEGALEGGVRWVYGHPYAAVEGVPLPCPQPPTEGAGEREGPGPKRKGGGGGLNLGCVIPSFDDDPKARFMDEIAYTTDGEIRSPQRKKARTAKGEEAGSGEAGRPLGELGKVTADEFWERMSFRQECVAGAVTGFFTLVVSGGPAEAAAATVVPGAQAGQVSGQVHKRILTMLLTGVEFSSAERAAKATETVEGAIRGLCEAAPAQEAPQTPRRRRGGASTPEPGVVGTGGISGSVVTRTAGGSVPRRAEAAVRVLAVRRKKKQ